ncbi:hypothetical protein KKH82_05660 [Patescibacteria group bacterium]|nr:hypothetical protein [Patescibacteria group bacterium]
MIFDHADDNNNVLSIFLVTTCHATSLLATLVCHANVEPSATTLKIVVLSVSVVVEGIKFDIYGNLKFPAKRFHPYTLT